jgi:hypothetical protein
VRELHVVAVSEDGRHLVLGASPDAGKGTHRLPIDARLASALRGELSKRPGRPARDAGARDGVAAGPPSVRDIQARLRTGESPEQIAASAGVPVESVARFAGPVLSERQKIIERAKATPLTRSRIGQSTLPLGEVLERQFAHMAAMRPETIEWTTRREESGTWLVQVTYVARARSRSGSWRFDPRARTLVAMDSVSAALGHSDNIEGTAAAIPVGSVSSAHGGGGRQKPAKRAGKRPAGPSTGARWTARPSAPEGTTARGGRAPAGSGVAGTVPAPGSAGGPAQARAPRAATAPAGPPALRVVPTLLAERALAEPAPADPAPVQPAAVDRAAAQPPASPAPPEGAAAKRAAGSRGRVSVPGWADVLLSTAPASARRPDEAAD